MTMPREYAKVWFTMWTDEDFCDQPIFDKLLYNVLLSQPPTLLNYCGTQPLSLKRWRKAMRDGDSLPSDLDVKAALRRMERRRYVFTDDETCEVLIRSFIRRDEVAKQPNVLLSALRAAALIESPKLAYIQLAELSGRVVIPEITAKSDKAEKLRRDLGLTLTAALTRLKGLSEGLSEPFPEPFAEDFPEGSPPPGKTEPFSEGFPEGFATGSVGVEVEVVQSPSVSNHLGEEPQPFCDAHPGGTKNPCFACGQAKRTHPQKLQSWKDARAKLRAAAIKACLTCDEYGDIDYGNSTVRCKHPNNPPELQEASNA